MKTSLAYVFCMRPGVRIHDGRNGVESSRCATALWFANWYGGSRLRWMFPGLMASVCGIPACVAASVRGHSVMSAFGTHSSESHPTMLPSASSPSDISTSAGGPFGSQPCSSARIHCTRTGLPISLAMSAASHVASS